MKKYLVVLLVIGLLCTSCPVALAAQESTFAVKAQLLSEGEIPSRPVSQSTTPTIKRYNNQSVTLDSVLYDGFLSRLPYIDISQFAVRYVPGQESQVISDSVNYVLNNYPELFAISPYYFYCFSGNIIVGLAFSYEINASMYQSQLAEYNAAIEQIISGMGSDFTDLEKILYVHEYFTANYEYDTSLQIFDAYTMLTSGTGVCQSYMLAFTAVMRRLGIFSVAALDDRDNHTWNIVELDGRYYHIDNTHDDPVDDRLGRTCHDFLLLSDSTIITKASHSTWYTLRGNYICDDKKYENYLWKTTVTPLVYCEGNWYMLNANGSYISDVDQKRYVTATLYKLNAALTQKTQVGSFSSPAWIVDQTHWNTDEYGMYTIGNMIFGHTNDGLWYFDPASDDINTITFSNLTDIYGSTYMGRGNILLETRTYDETDLSYTKDYFYSSLGLGDTDGDGEVLGNDLADLRHYMLTGECNFNWGLLDFNYDNRVNIFDLVHMKKYVAGAISEL